VIARPVLQILEDKGVRPSGAFLDQGRPPSRCVSAASRIIEGARLIAERVLGHSDRPSRSFARPGMDRILA